MDRTLTRAPSAQICLLLGYETGFKSLYLLSQIAVDSMPREF